MAKIFNEYVNLAGAALNVAIGQGTGLLAQRIEQYASIESEVAKTLRNNGETQAAEVADMLGDRARQLGRYLHDADGRRLFNDVQDALQGRAWVVAAAGLAAGLLVSRAIRTSPPAIA